MAPASHHASPALPEEVDLAIVGAGAAGLFAGIHAAAAAADDDRRPDDPPMRIALLDGAKTIGAKILVAGGGRCNVTHHAVSERDFAGGSRNAIRRVLRRWSVDDTVEFFARRGVRLKRESTGKLFPVTDRARSVLTALLDAAHDAGATLHHPCRVDRVDPPTSSSDRFRIHCRLGSETSTRPVRARRVVLATGGRSLPKTGSDGAGHAIARSLGHSLTPHVDPALVPLILAEGHPLRSLSGLAAPARLEVRSGSGRRLATTTGAVLCTHFGLSGPAALDISRHWTEAVRHDPAARLLINWLPDSTEEEFAGRLRDAASPGAPPETPARLLGEALPSRLVDALCAVAGAPPGGTLRQLDRARRRALATAVCALDAPVTGDRGWTHAEVTAGGVPLGEVDLGTLESRAQPGLHLCGEILDVDGRIGGFNFQWAWASGFVCGTGAAEALRAAE